MKKINKKMNKFQKWAESKKSACSKLFSKEKRLFKKDLKNSFSFGNMDPQQARIIMLFSLIMLVGYMVFIQQYAKNNFFAQSELPKQKSAEEVRVENFKKELTAIVKGHPIEAMVPYIAKQDRKTAAYVVGIAKKESNWGMRKPVLDGEDCYNYWGFRLKRERMGSGGHTCFDNPEDAVEAVSKRIDQIIERNDVESAKNMIVWKCGSNCAVTGGQAAAEKWITDVDMYAEKVLN